MLITDLSTKIRLARKEMNLTQEALAKKTGLNRSVINGLERGTLPDISFNRLTRVLSTLSLELRLNDASPLPTLDELHPQNTSDYYQEDDHKPSTRETGRQYRRTYKKKRSKP